MITSKGMVLDIPWPDAVPTGAPGPSAAAEHSYSIPERRCSPFLSESINALLRTLAASDPYTGQHSTRVSELASRFAQFLGLDAHDKHTLRNAVYLHDIGKIGISDAILLKPGPLTPEERRIINNHPLIGAKIVEPLGMTPQKGEIILLHHERWDGGGYPQGLSGESIPFLCRLTSLADVYDALTTDRPYRRKFSPDEAIKEIKKQAGRQFDPILAQEFVGFIATAALIPPF